MTSMTLAFDVEAIAALAEPSDAFDEAHQWADYVGVVSDGMAYQVVNFLREQGVYNEDFFSRADRQKSLEHATERTDTDRYVLVGTSEEDAELAERVKWEYLDVVEAAEAAGWDVTAERTDVAPTGK